MRAEDPKSSQDGRLDWQKVELLNPQQSLGWMSQNEFKTPTSTTLMLTFSQKGPAFKEEKGFHLALAGASSIDIVHCYT